MASMLAHLHANLNFAIYSLSNRTVRAAYRRLWVRVIAHCCRRTTPNNPAAAAAVATVAYGRTLRSPASGAGHTTEVDVNRSLVVAECHQ